MEYEDEANKFFKLNEIIRKVNSNAVKKYLHSENIQLNELNSIQLNSNRHHDLHNPVCVASKYNLVETITVLISHGFHPGECDLTCGLNPLQTACKHGAPNVVRFLLHECKVKANPDECSVSPLTLATQAGNVEIVTMLLAAGAEVNSTVLHIAATSNFTKLCQILISSGAAVDAADKDLATPLQLAVANGHTVPVCLLLAAGANANGNRKYKSTPLIASIGTRRLDLVKILCHSGADPDLPDADGHAPLHHATFFGTGNYDILRYLVVERGACLEPGGRCVDTPLSTAMRHLDARAVGLLVGAGYRAGREVITYEASLSDCISTAHRYEFLRYVKRLVFNPRSLREASCLQIRTELGRRGLTAIDTISLPSILKDMLALKHL